MIESKGMEEYDHWEEMSEEDKHLLTVDDISEYGVGDIDEYMKDREIDERITAST